MNIDYNWLCTLDKLSNRLEGKMAVREWLLDNVGFYNNFNINRVANNEHIYHCSHNSNRNLWVLLEFQNKKVNFKAGTVQL